MNAGKRVLIVSNRLPIKISRKDGVINYQTSEGGLATGLGSIYRQGKNLWIGWPGAEVEDSEKEQVTHNLTEQNLCPVFLTQKEINDFYEGFSNETLWPLFHYFPTYAEYNPQYWESYIQVNQKFADAIIKSATKDDVIWIHDYQLMLVPEMVRRQIPEVSIGFFQHIPFPSYEVFRLIPWRKELLNGLLGADVIGFHTYDDVRHFISAVNRITGLPNIANEIRIDSRTAIVDAFPISIDYKKYRALAEDSNTRRNERKLRQLINHNRLIISIDRLDYSKGIIHRLQAYQLFLEQHPELRGKVAMIQLVVPSRDSVPKYKQLKEEMNRMVSEINGKFSTLGWQPIQHFYRSFPIHLLSALYKAADVALVTPMRDGMNLVAKEFIASKTDQKGVLVLSEMAGASRELSEAFIINPNDVWDFADKIYQALNMPEDEQKRRMTAMQQTVSKFDIFNWVKNFMDKLDAVKVFQQAMHTRIINPSIRQKLSIRYYYGMKRAIFLDYDGTLVPFHKNVMGAVPDEELLQLLKDLCNDPHNKVIITSGRDYQTLDKWLGHLPVDIIAEHGAWYKDHGKFWRSKRDLNDDWKQEIYNVMNQFVRRTPGASIEEKSYSLAWHYRKVEDGLGNLRVQELMADIKHFVSDRGLQMLQGDRVLEIKSIAVNKGRAARRWLEKEEYDFLMAIGDDHTDEDTFKAMPEDAITIKVGSTISAATYYLGSYEEVRTLLREMVTAATFVDNEQGMLKEAS
ncbi:MAG TPA: bifunctional alpha,alpha-trehalose-phosphate synthase (UDP-forming)/trehalose-phosphatase [Flavipsychrobacter sp.]|mgnify:CR=1 FL=1|nr:bifunctional alpha,alpha-trehalose-phosphate synthase (UDP-forming)/trehalose-phosphatase [Flavipsychrobacter sp.]